MNLTIKIKKKLILIPVLLLWVSGISLAVEAPDDLRTEGWIEPGNPGGVEEPRPEFSWIPDPGVQQSAWQVIVSTDLGDVETGTGNSWDSSKVESTHTYTSYGLPGGGEEELKSSATYYWAVRTWDEADKVSPYSVPAFFEMNHFIRRKIFEYESEGSNKGHAAGDINGNDYTDLVLARHDRGTVDIYINDQTGSFSLSQSIEDTHSRVVALVDLNNNGYLDLIIINETVTPYGDIAIYMNDGDGNFEFDRELGRHNTASRAIAVGDINRNGHMDFVEALYNSENRIFFNDGTGKFGAPQELPDVPTADNTLSVVLADVNGNSYLDIIAGNYGGTDGEPNRIFINDGEGNFSLKDITGEQPDNTRGVAVTDINGNGIWDFVAVNEQNEPDVYYINDGSGKFELVGETWETDSSYSVSSGDITGDGMMDYFSGNSDNYNRLYKYVEGQDTFEMFGHSFNNNEEARSTILYDFTNDSRLDMTWGLREDSDIFFVNNDGPVNEPPSPPSGEFNGAYDFQEGHLKLEWGPGDDYQTSESQLAYNIRISSLSEFGPWTVISGAMGTTDRSGGFWGNIGRSTYVYLNIPSRTFYWQVQAVNTAKNRGGWSDSQIVNTPPEGMWSGAQQRDKNFVFEDEPLEYIADNRYHLDIHFELLDLEFNDCYLTGFKYSTSPAGQWHPVADEDENLKGVWDHSKSDYHYYPATSDFEMSTFTWITGQHLPQNFEGDIRIKYTIFDIHGASTTVVSSTFTVDNKNPQKPGPPEPTKNYDRQSIEFDLSTHTAVDTNFREYKIFWLEDPSPGEAPYHQPEFYDGCITKDNPGYGFLDFVYYGGRSSVTVSGLTPDTTYHFSIFGYDNFGNYSYSYKAVKKTNHPPKVNILSAAQRRDGSGLVDIEFEGKDHDVEISTYVPDGNQFWLGAGENYIMAPSYKDKKFSPELNFNNEFSTYTFVWNAKEDLEPAAGEDYSITAVQLKFTDHKDETSASYNTDFTVDISSPVLGNVQIENPIETSMDWSWDKAVEANFDRYELWYSSSGYEYVIYRDTSTAEVIEFKNIDTQSTTTLKHQRDTRYWGCLWAYDEFGYESRTATTTALTRDPPSAVFSKTPNKKRDGSGEVIVKVDVGAESNYEVRFKVEYSTAPDAPWQKATLPSTGAVTEGKENVEFTPEEEYQIKNIVTEYGTNTVTFNWLSQQDEEGAYNEQTKLRVIVNDGSSGIPGIDYKLTSKEFLINNSRPILDITGTYYEHDESILNLKFKRESFENEPHPELDKEKTDITKIELYKSSTSLENPVSLVGFDYSTVGPPGSAVEIIIPKHLRQKISRWDAAFRAAGEPPGGEPFLRILSSATADTHGNYSIKRATALFRQDINWHRDETSPQLEEATYKIIGGDIRLFLEFNQYMDVWTSPELSSTTIELDGLSIYASTENKREFTGEIYTIETGEMNSKGVYIGIPEEEHNIIWSLREEADDDKLYLDVSSRTIRDLSGNKVDPEENFDIFIDIDEEEEGPGIVSVFPEDLEHILDKNKDNTTARIEIYIDQFILPEGISDALRVIQVNDSEGNEVNREIHFSSVQAGNYAQPRETEQGVVMSSITFTPARSLPGNSKIRVKVSSENIISLFRINMHEDFKWSFRTIVENEDRNHLVSPSGRIRVTVEPGQFPSSGRIEFTEEIPQNEPQLASVSEVISANNAEATWGDKFHYPFEEFTTEVIFRSTEGIAQNQIFEDLGTITFDYTDLLYEDKYLRSGLNPPVKESTLKVYYLDENSKKWVPISSKVNIKENRVSAPLKNFSVYTVMGGRNYDMEDSHPYPVPYKPSERPTGAPRDGITFRYLPAECEIEIYTLSGRVVKTLKHSDAQAPQPGIYNWYPVENTRGATVASGTYIYHIKSGGNRKTGKLMIIR